MPALVIHGMTKRCSRRWADDENLFSDDARIRLCLAKLTSNGPLKLF